MRTDHCGKAGKIRKERIFMKPLVSIVIPVYKKEKFLERCMDSIFRQTFREYEVILVDDGSPDSSGEMCDGYARKDERVSVIHQKNMGPGPARNRGVQEAKCDYILFIDADDAVAPDYVEYMVSLIRKYRTPMAVVGGTCVWEERGIADLFRIYPVQQEKLLDCAEALEKMCYGREFGVAPWGKIYRKQLVEKYPYPPGMHEDLAVTYKMIGACEKIAAGKKQCYYYFQNADSIMTSAVEEKHLHGLDVARKELEDLKAEHPEVVPAAEFRCGLKIIEYVPRLLDRSARSRQMFRRLKSEMKSYLPGIVRNPRVGFVFKIRCIAVRCGYVPSYLMWKTVRWLKEKSGREGV